jgi:HK97 family phage prohead protease
MTLNPLIDSPPARLPFPITRAVAAPVETLASTDGMPTMVGHFSTFDQFYEVNSILEGRFLERIGRRAFDKTIRESRDQMKVLYDHGQDPQIGNKVLGKIEDLHTDRTGPAYTVPLFDTSYNRDLQPGLEAGQYGSSFRFTVEKDQWDDSPEPRDDNPDGIPERTITVRRPTTSTSAAEIPRASSHSSALPNQPALRSARTKPHPHPTSRRTTLSLSRRHRTLRGPSQSRTNRPQIPNRGVPP